MIQSVIDVTVLRANETLALEADKESVLRVIEPPRTYSVGVARLFLKSRLVSHRPSSLWVLDLSYGESRLADWDEKALVFVCLFSHFKPFGFN